MGRAGVSTTSIPFEKVNEDDGEGLTAADWGAGGGGGELLDIIAEGLDSLRRASRL